MYARSEIGVEKTVCGMLDELVVYDSPHLNKIRLGSGHDGGYVVLHNLCKEATELHSFGIGADMNFEMALMNAYTNIHHGFFYDPFIDELPDEHFDSMFRKESMLDACKGSALLSAKKNSILKADVEWSEWTSLLRIQEVFLRKFSQIIIEFHIVHVPQERGLSPYFNAFYNSVYDKINIVLFESYRDVLQKLNQSFYLFHIHANNSLPLVEIGEYLFPPLIEASFVRRDLVEDMCPSTSKFPQSGLDSSNKTDRPDIVDYYPWRHRANAE